MDERARKTVKTSRQRIDDVLLGKDDRLLAIVGPCSVHDVQACREYAKLLVAMAKELQHDLVVVMRVYFEKPRTTVGWKGLVNDPDLDGTNNINKGLRMARAFLLEVNDMGLPAGVEFLDTITPQYFADLVSWGAIGARTTESQIHRQLASGLSCAIGFKNATSGDVQIAVDACTSATGRHSFLSVTKDGVVAVVHTTGNPLCHLILRGGNDGPNYDAPSVDKARKAMTHKNLHPAIIVDCSHANACAVTPPIKKDFRLQSLACDHVSEQVSGGDFDIKGIMMESHLFEGAQSLVPGKTDVSTLKFGVSVTDGCLNFSDTEKALRSLASAVRARRALRSVKTGDGSVEGGESPSKKLKV